MKKSILWIIMLLLSISVIGALSNEGGCTGDDPVDVIRYVDEADAEADAAAEAAEEKAIEEERSIVEHLQLIVIPLETGYIKNENFVFGNKLPFTGTESDVPIDGFCSLETPEELEGEGAFIEQGTLTVTFENPIGLDMENPDAGSYFGEFPPTAQFNTYLLIPCSESYSFSPLEGSPLICRDPETGEVVKATHVLASSIPCNQLEQETEMMISDECTEALQEYVNTSSCDRLILYSECTEVPQDFIDEEASGCHYNYEVLLTVNHTPEETASTEAAQAEAEATEGIGVAITQEEGQPGVKVVEVVEGSAHDAGFQIGQVIFEVNGEPLYNNDYVNIFDVDTVADMINTGKKGSKVVIAYSTSNFSQALLGVLTRQ